MSELAAMVDQQPRSKEQLEREQLVRETLEAAARKIDTLSGSSNYQYAWKKAARAIRDMKP